MSCSAVGPAGRVAEPGRVVAPRPKNPPQVNWIITGTGPPASAGVLSVTGISTFTLGYEALSTWPTSFLVMIGYLSFISRVVLTISQVTFGVFAGMRP